MTWRIGIVAAGLAALLVSALVPRWNVPASAQEDPWIVKIEFIAYTTKDDKDKGTQYTPCS